MTIALSHLRSIAQFAGGSRPVGLLSAFARSRRGVAAVEFALVLPFMILLMLGSIEVARLITFTRKIELVANTAVEMLAQNDTSPQSNINQGLVTYQDLHFTQGSAVVIFPQILQDAANKGVLWTSDIAISMASIKFNAVSSSCTTSCTYNANVMWNSGSNRRPCAGNLTPVSDSSTPTPTTLPQDLYPSSTTSPQSLYGGGTVLVVDIVYTYTPLFIQKLFGSIKISRSAYMAPRYKSQGVYYEVVANDDGIGTQCSGYSPASP